MFYVYHLTDPRTDEVFYVGKGARGRIDAHEQEARAGLIHPKCDVIRAIWLSGMEVKKARIQEFESESEAYAFEADEIARIGLSNLTNIAAGGGATRPQKIGSIRPLIRIVARYFHLRSKAQRLNSPWHEAAEGAMPVWIAQWTKAFGAQIIKAEFAKCRIELIGA